MIFKKFGLLLGMMNVFEYHCEIISQYNAK